MRAGIFYFLCVCLGGPIFAEPLSVSPKSQRDCAILERFFRWGFEEQEYGYVLQGVKPISIAEYGGLDHCRVYKDFDLSKKRIEEILLVNAGVSAWKRACHSHHDYVLKAAPRKDPGSIEPGYEVSFIHLPKLREVVRENASLFRYVVDPGSSVEEIVERIAFSDESIPDILKQDSTLIGIALGFGAHNSLVCGRMESISALSISADTPPFSAKSILVKNYDSHGHYMSFCAPQAYGPYYLEYAGGDSSHFASCHQTRSLLQHGQKFSNLEEEVITLSSKMEEAPACLNEYPRFVFGAFQGGSSNQQLFKSLTTAQKNVQKLLKQSDFFDTVLKKIGGKNPTISHRGVDPCQSTLDLVGGDTDRWIAILKSHVENHLEDDRQRALFLRAFICPAKGDDTPAQMLGASKEVLKGLDLALANLGKSNAYFQKIEEDPKLTSIVPGRFYFQVDKAGSGETLKGVGEVRMGFTFEDLEGNLIHAAGDTWLDLSQTFPGFIRGVQGMREAETRTLIIHPAYAYGALTTLPPCSTFLIKVKLHEIGEQKACTLPALEPHDFSWLQDVDYREVIEASIDQIPRMKGAFYRKVLEEIEGVDILQIIRALRPQLDCLQRQSGSCKAEDSCRFLDGKEGPSR